MFLISTALAETGKDPLGLGFNPLLIVLIAVIVIVLIVLFRFIPIGMWIRSVASGVHISFRSLIGMRVRRIKPEKLVYPLIKATKAGLKLNITQLETHYLAGGNVDRVINALIAAQRANIPMAFEKACAIDLAGRNVFEAVQMSVTPKVIETPVVAAISFLRLSRMTALLSNGTGP